VEEREERGEHGEEGREKHDACCPAVAWRSTGEGYG